MSQKRKSSEPGDASTASAAPVVPKRNKYYTEDNMFLTVAAPQSLTSTISSWSSIMQAVYLTVIPSQQPGVGVLETRVSGYNNSCIIFSHVEIGIDHLGDAVKNKKLVFNVKNFGSAVRQIASKGALHISYDAQQGTYDLCSKRAYSAMKISIPEQVIAGMEIVGTDSPIPDNIPATVQHVIDLNVEEIKSFIAFLHASKAETLFVRIEEIGDRIFLTIGADEDGINAELKFYGTRTPSSTNTQTPAPPPDLVASTPMLRSTHLVDIDETRIDNSIHVGPDNNEASEEIGDALVHLREANVQPERYDFSVAFLHAFLHGLETKAKLIMAVIQLEAGPALFLRSSTPKSVIEIMLGVVIICD